MSGVFRLADAGPRRAARLGLAALLACVGMTWAAGASSAFATYGTVVVKKVNVGGDQADRFHFASSTAINATGGFDVSPATPYSSSTVHANAGRWDAAAYTVTESVTPGYALQDIRCTVAPAPFKPTYGVATPVVAERKVAIQVGVGEKVVCTFTNARQTGTIRVVKGLVPATDAGRFDLRVDGTPVRTGAGDGDGGSVTVPTGTHSVGEDVAAGSGARLEDYVGSTSCTKTSAQGPVDVPVRAGTIDVGPSDDITCVVRNERKAAPAVPATPAPTTPTTTVPTAAPPSAAPTVAPAAPAAGPARQQVAGVRRTARPGRGSAALRGPRACPRTASVSATVTGRQIRRVTFLVAGRRVKTLTRADARGRFVLTLRTASLRRGDTSVVARVEFAAASRTRARTLRLTIARCAASAASPRFTG